MAPMDGRRWLKAMTKATRPLLFLGLLGLLGACNLQGNGTTGATPCANPLFGPETPQGICNSPTAWVDEILVQGEDLPPETDPEWLLGKAAFFVPKHIVLRTGASGPTLGYLKLPDFPEHRFLVARRVPKAMDTQCLGFPYQGCFTREIQYGVAVFTEGMYELVGNGGLDPFFPYVTGKDGTIAGEWEWLTQVRTTRMVRMVQDPVDYANVLKADPNPHNGKTYAFKTRYRVEPRPGKHPKFLPEGTMAEPRRAPEYDAYPMSQGYYAFARRLANAYRVPEYARQGAVPWPELEAVQHYWDNESYYAFQVGSGIVSPPTPLCLPGLGWVLPFSQGTFIPRKVPLDYDRIPREYFESQDIFVYSAALAPYVPYLTHIVYLVGQDVVDYDVWQTDDRDGLGTYFPITNVLSTATPAPQYPVRGVGNPPGRTLRVGVLYRFTATEGWEPNPSHPYGEDEWHLVWSDVYLGGTKDNPDCRTLDIGFHTFDRATSARLDAHFGLAQVGRGLEKIYPFGLVPMLSRLGTRFFSDTSMTLAQPGEVKLPDWALPPDW